MKIDVTEANEAVVVAVTDEIVSRDDQQALSGAVADKLAEGRKLFVLDLSQVPYIGSLGIAVLVALQVKVDRAGGKLRLVNPRPRVAKVLAMTKVAGMFKTYSDTKEALAAE